MNYYITWQVVYNLTKVVLHMRHCFSGHRLTFRFFPFCVVQRVILFSIGAWAVIFGKFGMVVVMV